jgi:iron complex outermembrane receptor protein
MGDERKGGPMNRVRGFLLFLLTTALAFAPAIGSAQEEGEVAKSRTPTAVEEITVTAEKTEKDLQSTGLSIQAFDLEAMEKMGLSRTKDLGHFTPGLAIVPASSSSGQMSLTGRGAGDRDNNSLRPQKVGFYIDGNYVGTGNATNLDLLDIERIEVLKGPQGTLFGRNTIGGAISVISKKPDAELGGSVLGTVGMHDERSIRASLNVPLIDEKLFSRIAIARKHRGPFFVNSWPGATKEYDDVDEVGGRIALRWLATERITADWSFERIQHDNATPGNQLTDTASAGSFNTFLAPYIRTDNGNFLTNAQRYYELDMWQSAFTLTWDVSESMTVKSISGWRSYDMKYAGDSDGTPLTAFHAYQGDDHSTFYQEIQATGENVLGGWLDYAFGATWFEEEAESETWAKPFEFLTGGSSNSTTRVEGDNHALGLYTQLTSHLTDRLDATAGIRFTSERRWIERSRCNSAALFMPENCPNPPGTTNFLGLEHKLRTDNWSPMFRLAYDWTDDLMTYVSWTRGFNSAAFNVRFNTVNELAPYDDETVSQWEIGLKSQWFDNRLRLNGSAFYSEYEDMQVAVWNGTVNQWANAGRARIRGWELDVTAVPVDGLRIGVVHGWTKADFSEFMECPPASPPVGCTKVNRADFYRLAVTPRRTYAGFASYTFDPTSMGTFEISANFRRQSPMGYLNQVDQFRRTSSNRYTVYGARAGLYDAFGVSGLSLAVVGSNITDRSYIDNSVDFGSGASERFTMKTFGDPRHVVLEVGYEF